jgi:hypothetical protein
MRSMKEYGLQSIRIPGSSGASDQARAIRGDGLGRAAQALLSAAPAGRAVADADCCPTPSSRASSMPARPIRPSRRIVDGRRDLRPRLRRARRCRERRPLSPRLASCWATAPAPARAARSPASCSTTGSRAADGGLDQQIRQADRGCAARLVGARHGAPAGHAAVPLPPGQADPASEGVLLPPTPRYAPTRAARRFRASSRSSNGWAPISTE